MVNLFFRKDEQWLTLWLAVEHDTAIAANAHMPPTTATIGTFGLLLVGAVPYIRTNTSTRQLPPRLVTVPDHLASDLDRLDTFVAVRRGKDSALNHDVAPVA